MDRFFHTPVSWLYKTYGIHGPFRYPTFKSALNLLYRMPNHRIIETGTVRLENDWGGGLSTLLFSEFVHRHGGHLTTVDISIENMEVSKKVTAQFKDNIEYVVSDSIEYLLKIDGVVDLLYLDSVDCPAVGDAIESQQHQLKELKAAWHLINQNTIILLDDNNFENGGKTRLTNEYLYDMGWVLLVDYAQALWINPKKMLL